MNGDKARQAPGEAFLDLQKEYFAEADAEHFEWQTSDPYLSVWERELLELGHVLPEAALLEVGCGEGSNIAHLGRRPGMTIGLDFSHAKVAWAARHLRGPSFVCGDATSLPIASASLDAVLCRDVLHHVQDKPRVLTEIARVLRPGGEIILIEPNGRNPIVRLQSMLVAAERGLRQSTSARLTALLGEVPVTDLSLVRAVPMPIGRALFHPRYGAPRLSRFAGGAVRRLEAMLSRIFPKDLWAYIVVRAKRA